jgi:hypothetical protein
MEKQPEVLSSTAFTMNSTKDSTYQIKMPYCKGAITCKAWKEE